MIHHLVRLIAICGLVAVTALPAAAAQLEASGWWWRAQTGVLVDLPPPPHVPEDALVVGNGPDGATAIAAIRFRLADDETDPVLRLQVLDARGDEPEVIACPITEVWFADHAGRWEDVPDHDCASAVAAGTSVDDGDAWEFSLTTVTAGAMVNVVLRPPDGTQTIFEIVFEEPSDASLRTSRGDDDFTPPPVEAAPPAAESDAAGSDGAMGSWQSEAPPPVEIGPEPGASGDDPGETVPPPVAAEPPPDTSSQAAPPPGDTPGQVAAASGAGGVTDRFLAALLLAVGLLVAADLLWQTAPAPRRLGRSNRPQTESSPERGFGRFRRPRVGRPTPLV